MTKYVISGYIGFDNFGDELIASSLIKHLQENENNTVTVISASSQKTSDLYNCFSVGKFSFIPAVIKSDILISGGGSLLQDITSLKSLIYYLTIIIIALFFRKKVYIFAQGITPFRTKLGKILTIAVLKRCYKITLRDQQSQKYLDKWKISSEIISDPAWGVKMPKCDIKKGVGIQLRYHENLSDDFLKNLARNIAENFQNEKLMLLSLQDSMDYKILQKFQDYLKKYNLNAEMKNNLSVSEIIDEISQLEFLIGMRFHACLVASKAKVKILALDYDVKVNSLSKNIGFPLINLVSCEIPFGINKLISVDPNEYKIPDFIFPNFDK